jgi:hypothetical protein
MTEPEPDAPGGAKRSAWRWVRDDDLLKGLDREGGPGLRAFFASTIAASLLVWELAFDLGAYHTVFYSRLFQIVVVATVLLIGSIALHRRLRVRLWMRAVLCFPLLWLLSRLVVAPGSRNGAGRVFDDVLIGLTVLCVPFIAMASARVMVPEYFTMRGQRMRLISILIVVLVAVSGFLVGQFNYRFTTCQEYVLAGDDLPANCKPPPPPAPTP